MKILIVVNRPFIPESFSGQNRTVQELSRALIGAGHQLWVLADWKKKIGANGIFRDESFGFILFRASNASVSLSGICLTIRPDVAIVIDGNKGTTMNTLAGLNIPSLVWYFEKPIAESYYLNRLKPEKIVATTPQIARHLALFFDADVDVIPPYIDSNQYINPAVDLSSRRKVLFINPLRAKGASLLFKIARHRPDYRFVILESREVPEKWKEICFEQSQICGNIEWLAPGADISEIYSESRLLLLPRLNPEGFARIIVEAQLNSIPVLASDYDYLTENVGPGGSTISLADGLQEWLQELDRYMQDNAFHLEKGKQAKIHGSRSELNTDTVLHKLLDILTHHMKSQLNQRFYRSR